MNAILGVVPMAFVETKMLRLIYVCLSRNLFRETHFAHLKLGICPITEDVFPRHSQEVNSRNFPAGPLESWRLDFCLLSFYMFCCENLLFLSDTLSILLMSGIPGRMGGFLLFALDICLYLGEESIQRGGLLYADGFSKIEIRLEVLL